MRYTLKRVYRLLPANLRGISKDAYHYYKALKWMPKNALASIRWNSAIKGKINNINLFEQRFFSQNGEDGIIRMILAKIGTTNRFCVEFGVENGRECNTRFLIKQGWKYLHMDGSRQKKEYTRIMHEFITAENINYLFRKYKVPERFDLLSIDLDYNTYWVWKALEGYFPRVVVIEYNASVPPAESKAVRYNPDRVWDGTDYFGASLLALAKLGKDKGYTLIGCESHGINAFFVRNELKDHFIVKGVSKVYMPPRYGVVKKGKFLGHPKSRERMINV